MVPFVPAEVKIEKPLPLISSAPGVKFAVYLGWQSKSFVTSAKGTPIELIAVLLAGTRCRSVAATKTGCTSIEFASFEVAAVQSASVA
jgi:hypothetical protein